MSPELINAFLSVGSNMFQNIRNDRESDEQRHWSMYMQDRANMYNTAMFDRANEYNSPANQMLRYQQAGLNPNLIYGQGNSGNATPMPSATAPTSPLPDLMYQNPMSAYLQGKTSSLVNQQTENDIGLASLEWCQQTVNDTVGIYEGFDVSTKKEVDTSVNRNNLNFYNTVTSSLSKTSKDYLARSFRVEDSTGTSDSSSLGSSDTHTNNVGDKANINAKVKSKVFQAGMSAESWHTKGKEHTLTSQDVNKVFETAISIAEEEHNRSAIRELRRSQTDFMSRFSEHLRELSTSSESISHDAKLYFRNLNRPLSAKIVQRFVDAGYFEKRNGNWEMVDENVGSIGYDYFVRILNYLDRHPNFK